MIGDLEAGGAQSLPGGGLLHSGDGGHPGTGGAVDVARISRWQRDFAEVGGDRQHRCEPRPSGFIAAEQVSIAALAQRERAQLTGVRGVVVYIAGRCKLIGEPKEGR